MSADARRRLVAAIPAGCLLAVVGAFLGDRDPAAWLQALALWCGAAALVAVASISLHTLAGHGERGLRALYVSGPSGQEAGRGRLLSTLALVALLLPAIQELSLRPGAARILAPAWITLLLVVLAFFAAWWFDARLRRGVTSVRSGIAVSILAVMLLGAGNHQAATPLLLGRVTAALAAAALALVALERHLPARLAGRAPAVAAAALGVAGLVSTADVRAPQPRGDRLVGALQTALPVDAPAGDAPARGTDLRAWFGRARSPAAGSLDALLPGRRDWNLLWITVCSLRRDRLGVVGGGASSTPRLDALARDGQLFERAWAPCPVSDLSMHAMFSGMYPGETNAFRERSGRGRDPDQYWLPEGLRAAGRVSWALTAFDAGMLRPGSSFVPLLRTFDVRNPYDNLLRPRGATLVQAFERQLAARPATTPFFAWLQLMDCHVPYKGEGGEAPAGTDELQAYAAAVRYTDGCIGRVLDALASAGAADRTLVVVNGDHGEEFWEHGGRYHYTTLYEEQAAVPLVLRVPGLPPRRVSAPVDLTDLAPTVAELLDLPAPTASSGDSLVPALLGEPFPSLAHAGQRVVDGRGRGRSQADPAWTSSARGVLRPGSGSGGAAEPGRQRGGRREAAGGRPGGSAPGRRDGPEGVSGSADEGGSRARGRARVLLAPHLRDTGEAASRSAPRPAGARGRGSQL